AAATPAAPSEKALADLKLEQSSGLGLVHSPALEQLLNESLQRIQTSSGFTDVPARVYLLASPGMNAYTSAAGNIYIPVPMVLDIETQDEMDALLAHEFAHAVFGHNDIDLLKTVQKKATTLYSLANR